jgi:transposase
MAAIKVCDPVSVPLSILQELQQLRALLEQIRLDNQRLQQDNQRLQRDNERLQRELDQARTQCDQAQRRAKRQTAPFSKGPPKDQPKKPGRKAGAQHGPHGHRLPPSPDRIDETHDAPLPEVCSRCGGPIDETHIDQQFQTDMPRRPVVRRFDVHCGRCRRCGQSCRGRHPLQTSDATGACASQVGPDAQAAVVLLNKEAGLSYGKVARLLSVFFGITLTRGACTQIVLRAGQRLQPAYQEIRQHLAESKRVTPDETGWRVGGQPAWLHAWVGDDVTGYVIDPKRDAGGLEAVLGLDWEGVLIHDGFASYDRFMAACHQQCLAHPLRRAHNLEGTQVGMAKQLPRQVIDLLCGALQVRDLYRNGDLTEVELAGAHAWYVDALHALTERPRTNAANERLARHLWVHAEQWFQFLIDPSIPATNYLGEQAIRPAVVNRKVWGGNRTEAGAAAQGVILSVLRTCLQQVVSAFNYIRDTLCRGFTSLCTPIPSLAQR